MYLQRRNGVYWFRKAVPLNLVPLLGHAEIRFSLRTHRRDEAKRKASVMQVALETVYAVFRDDNPLEPAKALLGSFLQDFVRHGAGTPESIVVASLKLKRATDTLGAPALPFLNTQEATWVSVDDVEPLLARERPRAEANAAAADLLKLAIRMRREGSWSRAERSKALLALCQKVAVANERAPLDTPHGLRALRAIIREEVSRAGLGTTINQTPQFDAAALREIVAGEVRAGVTAAGRDRWSSELLSKMIGNFLRAQYPSEEGKSKVGSKHREDVERRLAAFLAFTGDLAVRDITRDHLKAYRDVLDQLPDRFEARLKTKVMRLAVEKNAQRKVPYPVIGPTTINLKWIGPVDRLFDWLVTEEKIEKNSTDGIRSNQEVTEAANTKRLPLKPDQINKLYAITSAGSPRTALYWLPLLMLTTGARPNELAQLRTDDLDRDFNGRPHLNVLCLLDDDDEAADAENKAEAKDDPRRVKTLAGRRMIPLHPVLIKAGFIEFIEWRHKDGAKQLFRELRPDQHGFWSSAITKRLNRIIREKLGITNPRYSAYSLRHNFIDSCRSAKIPKETRMKIVGHQLEGVHGGYGNPWVLPNESALIDAVPFDGIDFGDYLTQIRFN
jgi:integrase